MKNDIGKNDYAYVYSFPLQNETEINLSLLSDILLKFGETFSFSGCVEIYKDERVFGFSGNSQDEGIRLLRIGVALTEKNYKKRQPMLDWIFLALEKDALGIASAPELSEAATVGTIRDELEIFTTINFIEGKAT
jgi:hypothetical protein